MLLPSYRAKHPVKAHILAGISVHGATHICLFEGIMKLYVEILKKALQKHVYSCGMRFMQDNDPKHTSKLVQKWMKEQNIKRWKTLAESPDLNPIDNLWHELKEYTCWEIKPMTKNELVQGTVMFWSTVDVSMDNRAKKWIGNVRGWSNANILAGGIPFDSIRVDGSSTIHGKLRCRLKKTFSIVGQSRYTVTISTINRLPSSIYC